jgi:hypothetical protein
MPVKKVINRKKLTKIPVLEKKNQVAVLGKHRGKNLTEEVTRQKAEKAVAAANRQEKNQAKTVPQLQGRKAMMLNNG